MILTTAFEPFGSYRYNLSKIILDGMSNSIGGIKLFKKLLPVNWYQCIIEYESVLESLKENLALVIILGIQQSDAISLEKYAYNWKLGIDNNGNFKFGLIKFKDPLVRSTIIPIQEIKNIIKERVNKLRLQISLNPGFYLCNYIYFWALKLSKKRYPVLFIHIPHKGSATEIIWTIKEIIMVLIKSLTFFC